MEKRRIKLTVFILLLACTAGDVQAGKTVYDFRENLYAEAPPQEVMALPKFCWGTYIPKLKGPRYNIDKHQCGVRTNHYCQGLLRFNRGLNPMVSAGESSAWLSLGAQNILYTLEGIKNYPGCPITNHVKVMSKKAVAAQAALKASRAGSKKVQP